MIRALVTGENFANPQERTGKRQAFALARVSVPRAKTAGCSVR